MASASDGSKDDAHLNRTWDGRHPSQDYDSALLEQRCAATFHREDPRMGDGRCRCGKVDRLNNDEALNTMQSGDEWDAHWEEEDE